MVVIERERVFLESLNSHRRGRMIKPCIYVSDIATDPDSVVIREAGGWSRVTGTRDGVVVRVVLNPSGNIWTAYPINVMKNP